MATKGQQGPRRSGATILAGSWLWQRAHAFRGMASGVLTDSFGITKHFVDDT
ncbi:hypothetical protein V1289_003213 [Bradyrhizobium sp. AZCC 2289]